MPTIPHVLQTLGLSKNEAKVYETLLQEGESSVGNLAIKSRVHRRNVYDTLNRLIEKGLALEILEKPENHYQAVDPNKFSEILEERQQELFNVMPELERLYGAVPHREEVYIYRGIEGWKNYMRTMLKVGQDVYTIGGKGSWADPRLASFFKQFLQEAKRKNMTFHILFDHEARDETPEQIRDLGQNARFLPPEASSPAGLDVFGDHVVILANTARNRIAEEASSITVIVNPHIAEAFRTWFKLLWSTAKE
jgi:sugar-specific transcriptional regulator TrmB